MNLASDSIILIIALTALGFSVRSWQLQSKSFGIIMEWRRQRSAADDAPREEREEYGDFDEEEEREA